MADLYANLCHVGANEVNRGIACFYFDRVADSCEGGAGQGNATSKGEVTDPNASFSRAATQR
jgi:hypothetical protein